MSHASFRNVYCSEPGTHKYPCPGVLLNSAWRVERGSPAMPAPRVNTPERRTDALFIAAENSSHTMQYNVDTALSSPMPQQSHNTAAEPAASAFETPFTAWSSRPRSSTNSLSALQLAVNLAVCGFPLDRTSSQPTTPIGCMSGSALGGAALDCTKFATLPDDADENVAGLLSEFDSPSIGILQLDSSPQRSAALPLQGVFREGQPHKFSVLRSPPPAGLTQEYRHSAADSSWMRQSSTFLEQCKTSPPSAQSRPTESENTVMMTLPPVAGSVHHHGNMLNSAKLEGCPESRRGKFTTLKLPEPAKLRAQRRATTRGKSVPQRTGPSMTSSPLSNKANLPSGEMKVRKAPGRKSSGCWTCKLRRKKCDETHPTCRACELLGLHCEGYSATRPSFMTDPVQNSYYRRLIKEMTSNAAVCSGHHLPANRSSS